MTAKDNGFLNSAFLSRCAKLGYSHPSAANRAWTPEKPVISGNAYSIMERYLLEDGFTHLVFIGGDPPLPDVKVRELLERYMSDGCPFNAAWSSLLREDGRCFYFENEQDAILFKLSVD